MAVNVQSMLDELREEMTSFEGSLPGISDRDALDGLLGIKQALRLRWAAGEVTDGVTNRPVSTRRRALAHVSGVFLVGSLLTPCACFG